MAYVPGFHYDIFVSYSCDDSDDRLRTFVRDLNVALRRELGKEFTEERGMYFYEQDLNKAPIDWKKALRASVGSAAILVPIFSTSYATSDYCAFEFDWFSENPPLDWPAGDQTVYRVCPVVWRSIDDPDVYTQLASELRRAQEHRSVNPDELAKTLANGLRMMRRSRDIVYVGESEDAIRKEIRAELSRMGFRVEPQAPSAFQDAETIRQLLGKAKLAIHFAGGQDKQRALDAIRDSRDLCQHSTLVYEIPGAVLTDEETITLEWLEKDIQQKPSVDGRAYDRISGAQKNLDQFLQVIRDRLADVRPASLGQIGIACEEADRPAVESLLPVIWNQTGLSVVCHGLDLVNFKKSRGILLYWGKADGSQLRQIHRVLKMFMALFVAPPPKPDAPRTESPGQAVLSQQGEQFQLSDIQPFLEGLGWRR